MSNWLIGFVLLCSGVGLSIVAVVALYVFLIRKALL